MPLNLTPSQRLRRLADIPNLAGYRFVGVKRDGTHAQCHVVRDAATGLHSIAGEALHADLIGWLPKI